MEDDPAEEIGPPPADGKRAPFPIVGIGASAGGIEALQKFLPAIDSGIGMAFVLVQHLDPNHKSALSEVLSRDSQLPVTAIENDTEVEANHIYVIPPDAALTIAEGRLLLTKPVLPRGHRTPIDEFFTSLAHDQGENAACVILSGTGSDGTLGLRAIKENGGVALAQTEAGYDGMMRSAVATGLVDFVLPAQNMPAKLREYFGHVRLVDDQQDDERGHSGVAEQLGAICRLLLAQSGHDFSGYKERTVIRRVQRRMHVLQIDDPAKFVERLSADPHEVKLLFQDLLIGVTAFFRDKEAFEALRRQVIPTLLAGKGPRDTVRVWVPACATGEEAYTLAMLLREAAAGTPQSPRVQVFASDIDSNALQFARNGRYPAAIAKDVPPRLLERYFSREDGTFRVAGELREICLFSNHDLLRDPPFSRLDLLSCRNLLIYLNAALQSRVIPLFQYAINPGGFLFLGTSEYVTKHGRLFSTIDKPNRIFQRRAEVGRALPVFPLSALDPVLARHGPAFARPKGESSLQAIAEQLLLNRYAPSYVIVNADGEVLHTSGRTGKYLELAAGVPDTNIFSMARPGLRPQLRAAIREAAVSEEPVVHTGVSIEANGTWQQFNVTVQPLRYAGIPASFYMVVFQETGGATSDRGNATEAADDDAEDAHVRQLERGEVGGAIAAVVDISEHRRAEAQQQVLLHELQHRVKNVLATVGSLANRMAKTAGSIEEFQESFLARVQGMGRIHDLLSGGVWQGADLRSVIATALEPYSDRARATLELQGPSIMLSPNRAATLGMIFHELATNAAKYGALSAPAGHLRVTWEVAAGAGAARQVKLTWAERDGPAVAAPASIGFGASFVRRSVEYEMNGSATLEFIAEGLRCTINFPLDGNAGRDAALKPG